jgi:long-chain acyl-CoA synthetase
MLAAEQRRPRVYPQGLEWNMPLRARSVLALFDDAAAAWPDHHFLDFLGRKQTYSEVAREIGEVVGGMRLHGIGPGSRVGLLLPNSPYFVVALLAALRCGATVVLFSTLLAESELAVQLDDSAVEILFTLDVMPLLARCEGVLRASRLRRVIVCGLLDCLPYAKRLAAELLGRGGRVAWEEDDLLLGWRRLRGGEPDGRAAPVDPTRDAAVILYTAGTTGQPRGVSLSHANLTANASQLASWFTVAKPGTERLVAVLPFFHAFGLSAVLLFGIALGAELVLLPRFEPKGFTRMLRRTRPTFLAGVPTLFGALLDLPGARRADFASLKVCVSGGDALPTPIRERFEGVTGVPLTQGYGLTECSPVVTCSNPLAGCERPGSVGLPLPRTEVEIRDPGGLPVAEGAIGEIHVRGPQVMQGYAGRHHETISVLCTGWLRTGDLGRIDADGYLWVVDRLKDVIITSCTKVYPHHVEEALLTHSAIAEAAVVGEPDARVGAVPVAHLVLRPGATVSADELRLYLAPMISRPAIPRWFSIHASLPRTRMGKVERGVLAART